MAKVLVTDDAMFMRTILKNILVSSGHEVYEACNGLDLLNKYPEVKPDVVTLDITMPEMDGLQAVKELKKLYPEAKVIMCSAMGQQPLVLEAMKGGANDFLVKPFEKGRVLEAIIKVTSIS